MDGNIEREQVDKILKMSGKRAVNAGINVVRATMFEQIRSQDRSPPPTSCFASSRRGASRSIFSLTAGIIDLPLEVWAFGPPKGEVRLCGRHRYRQAIPRCRPG
ncbi:hypothetical protein FRAAL0693 [Frankia alni ACN14a]|uniref:Uncharacterized protein n=1 Tax=Frankia alni (strain DSM 45986 / CECT 9034 / ACN14a) TaxID=326424 RepID=Q0RSU2_FRAAA|nr:hypothetical protein FRAAL0693 [Frankia alni ACN14a]